MKENEIVIQQDNTALATNEDPLLMMIDRVCSDPQFDIAKMEKLIDMRNAENERQAKIEYAKSIAEMQEELPTIVCEKQGHNSKYASFDNIKKTINPILSKYGFKDLYFVNQEDKQVCITVKLMHKSGHSEQTSLILPHDTTGSKNPVQSIGSTISYGRRYGLLSILGIATGDDNDAERYIAAETAEKIKTILKDNEFDVSGFLKFMKVNSIEEIYSKDFEKADIALGRKLKEDKPLFNANKE
jgi:hypothetical protein